jgi:hypothetical protein
VRALDAEAFLVSHLAVAADHQIGAGDLTGRHVCLEPRSRYGQLGGIEAQRCRIGPDNRGDLRIDDALRRGDG